MAASARGGALVGADPVHAHGPAGRQAGKSRTLAVLSLHTAFTTSDARVLIISATEDDAKDLLAEVSMLASNDLLGGSVLDDMKSEISFSNGATIRSIPSSMKQARGKSVDLLILDEACFIDEDVWTAAKYTIIAKPGSRVVMTSTPWGRADRFFAVNYRAGLAETDGYASWHWPSTVSPLVDVELLEMWRKTSTEREYRAEVLAEWVDAVGAYFDPVELEAAVKLGVGLPWPDPGMLEPAPRSIFVRDPGGRVDLVSAGVDWGMAHDACSFVGVGRVPGEYAADPEWWVPIVVEQFGTTYSAFIDRIVTIGARAAHLGEVVSETNGVGQMPTSELQAALPGRVVPVHTTAQSKEDGFGVVKMLLQKRELALPRHPALLRQLSALEYEQRDSGSMAIAVPERAGHDDVAMGLCLAMGPLVNATGRVVVAEEYVDARLWGRR